MKSQDHKLSIPIVAIFLRCVLSTVLSLAFVLCTL